jgi:hypothetical protein
MRTRVPAPGSAPVATIRVSLNRGSRRTYRACRPDSGAWPPTRIPGDLAEPRPGLFSGKVSMASSRRARLCGCPLHGCSSWPRSGPRTRLRCDFFVLRDDRPSTSSNRIHFAERCSSGLAAKQAGTVRQSMQSSLDRAIRIINSRSSSTSAMEAWTGFSSQWTLRAAPNQRRYD